jgi:hypothetical protein
MSDTLNKRAAHSRDQPQPPNSLEVSCPAAQATVHPFSRNSAGKARSNFPPASRVSCSELLARPDTPPRKLEFMAVVCAES